MKKKMKKKKTKKMKMLKKKKTKMLKKTKGSDEEDDVALAGFKHEEDDESGEEDDENGEEGRRWL